MRRVAVRGADRFRWLSGMVTNTVNDLFPNTGAWNLVLNAQGHIQGDLTVWRGGEESSPQRRSPSRRRRPRTDDRLLGTPFAGESGLELEIAADQIDKLLAHLNRFIIMDDVELVPLGEEQVGEAGSETAMGLTGPQADEVLERVGLPVIGSAMAGTSVEWNGWDLRILRGYGVLAQHYEFWLPSAGLAKLWSCLRTGGATPVGCASLEAFRIAEGIPAYGIDMVERDLPQETSQMRALHFAKGCYLGQEIVERIRSRGNVHRHLRPLELSGPVPAGGAELTLESGRSPGKEARRNGCRTDHQRGRVAARGWPSRVCAGHDAQRSGGAQAGLPLQSRGAARERRRSWKRRRTWARNGCSPCGRRDGQASKHVRGGPVEQHEAGMRNWKL